MMKLYPKVKSFIEENIRDIEKENMHYIFSASLEDLNDEEFNQLFNILMKLDIEVELVDIVADIIKDHCEYIETKNIGNDICIEDEWEKYSSNYLGDKISVIEYFNDYDPVLYNNKHYCTIPEA